MTKNTIGIDISKDMFEVHRLTTDAVAQFPNPAAGLRALLRWIGEDLPVLVVYEATGIYHRALERSLAGVLPLVKVNPRARPAASRRPAARGPRPILSMRGYWRGWAMRLDWFLTCLRTRITIYSRSCGSSAWP